MKKEFTKELIISKSDHLIKSKLLKWKNLFELGLTLEEALNLKNSNFFDKTRPLFSNLSENCTKEDLINLLINKEKYRLKAAIELVNNFNSKDLSSILEFISKYNEHKKRKDNLVDYYIIRGYSEFESYEIVKKHCQKCSEKIKEKRKNSEEYDKKYRESKRFAALQSAISPKKTKSKFEIDLFSFLDSIGYKSEDLITPVYHLENKKFYIHDAYINNFIIEYNGTYWHKDFIRRKEFTKEDYIQEIKKAKYCIELKRDITPSYIIIWEGDFNDYIEAAQFIIDCINTNKNSTFFSSREIDLNFYKNLNDRENDHNRYLNICEIFSEKSKCVSHKVCALFVKNGKIISTGLNGTPPGYVNCNEIFKKYDSIKDRESHKDFSDKYEIHAEQNALIYAAREGISIKDTILYCTHQPCWQCLKMIISAGIKEIYFKNLYDRIGTDKNWWDFASENGVKVEHITEDIKN